MEVGSLIDVEKLDAAVGDRVTFSSVLAVADDEASVASRLAYLDNTSVTAEVVQQARGKKMVVFKSKRRKGYKSKLGHRQSFTRVKITAIGAVEEQSDGS